MPEHAVLFLRESVSDASIRAGFAPVLLNPINFETLFSGRKSGSGCRNSDYALMGA